MFGTLEILMFTVWTCFVPYATWYFTSAKHYAPITLDDARLLWKIHKQNIGCNATKWREIKRKSKIIGFECECGYRHIQKRPIVANTPSPHTHSQVSVLEKLHSPHKST